MSDFPHEDLGPSLANAAQLDDSVLAATVIRGGNFIVFQQIDTETGQGARDNEGGFSVVLAAVEEDTAVVCFSNPTAAEGFVADIADSIPAGRELPSVVLDGNTLLNGLPSDCGLLVNPGADTECYFPPGCFDFH